MISTFRYCLIFSLFILSSPSILAQKYLQVEKINSLKLLKYNLGDDLVFRTKLGEKDWYSRTITDLNHGANMIFLDNSGFLLDDLTYIKSFKNRGWSRGIAQSMRYFALSWLVYSGIDELFYSSADWEVAAYAATSSVLLSVPIELLFKSKTHNVNSKFRLRIMNIQF